jgi:hypothetical protein
MPGVKPARWRGRYHWITIVDVSRFPPDYLRELVDASYQRALRSLSKARQVEIIGARCVPALGETRRPRLIPAPRTASWSP